MSIEPIVDLLDNRYCKEEYPALYVQLKNWERDKPLNGIKLLDATPVYRNSLLKYRVLMAAGADLSVGISSVMAHNDEIVKLLRDCGVNICSADECGYDPGFDIVMDCAGAFSSLSPRIGYVELTRSGADAYRDNCLPVFYADGGMIKRIETCLGTGESFFRAMRYLGYNDWKGRKLVLFGCGKVGSGILYYAYKAGAKCVVVTDTGVVPERVRDFAAGVVDFKDIAAVVRALDGAFAVVTATGVRNALKDIPAEALTGCGALLANMGVEDEYGPAVDPHFVLNGKKTLNFILEEPTLMRFIDATMALHNAGALFLLEQHLPAEYRFILPPAEMEDEILSVTRRDGLIGDDLHLIV